MARKRRRSGGLLILSGRHILVLKRSPAASNANTWGLPGGRCDAEESPGLAALREATEELGEMPPSDVVGCLSVRRARAGRYDVYVCRTPAETRQSWQPRLCAEHTRYRWVRLEWLFSRLDRLHPVLRTICEKPDVLRLVCDVMERERTLPSVPPRRRKQTVVIAGANAFV